MKDRHYICVLLNQIDYKGPCYTRLKDADVCTVKDLLRLLYTNPKRLEEILELKASCKFWDEIVKSAHAFNGTFLYLDPRNEQKTGVLDVKLQLKALIVEPHQYIAVNQLTEQQKFETRDLVKFASEHFDMLLPFDHETYLEEHLQSMRNDVTTQSERGKQKAPLDDDMILSSNENQEYVPFHRATNGLNFGAATQSGTSSQVVESLLDTCELMSIIDTNSPVLEGSRVDSFLNGIWDIIDASPNISFCAIVHARWTKVSKLLRRNSVRERISLSQEIQPLKKQRC
ncbi:putative CALMODULIN-BINDING PROTEIN60 [Helianthus anomalus]